MWWSHGQSKDPVELGGRKGGVAQIDKADGPEGKLSIRKGRGKTNGRTGGRAARSLASLKTARSKRRRKGR